MADVKISALPASTTPLAGTEVLPIVQSGVTKKTSIESVLTSVQPSGTANGVAYLNGSKVLTSGSALTFDGSNLETTGNTTLANNKSFRVKNVGGTAQALLTLGNDDNVYMGQVSSPTAAALFLYGSQQIYYAGASEAMRLTSTGLGIGTSSPSNKLHVVTSGTALGQFTGAQYSQLRHSDGTRTLYTQVYDNLAILGTESNTPLSFVTNGTVKATVDSSGNLGIGTSSPGNALVLNRSGATNTYAQFYNGANTAGYVLGLGTDGNVYSYAAGAFAQIFGTNNTERARIDSSGNLLVGTTSGSARLNVAKASGDLIVADTSGGGTGYVYVSGTTTGTAGYFQTSSGLAGSIQCSGTTTTYNITSDYRLKTVVGPVANSGQRIDALQPVEYTWNADGSRTCGFLAHKFQEVYPSSVTGAKDAVDAEGNPVYQQMQASTPEVIADLVAEIQSLRQRLAAAGI